MKNLFSVWLLLLPVVTIFAQVTDLGGPFAWRSKFEPSKIVDRRVMPGFDAAQVAYEDSINDLTKEGPWRFGYKYETNFSPENSGTWTELPGGNRLWQIEILCQGAMTVNFIFENFYMPEGAYIYLYDKDRTNRVGAYTSRNNNAEAVLGTELVHGEQVIVEYYEPARVAGQGHFTIANVVHGYRSLNKIQKDLLKALEDSGNCNVDVNCPLGDGWENQIRSVAMIVVGGSGICTGALINNTCNDGTPYFLTANHCVGGGSTASWSFRFNWESPPGTEVCQTVGVSVNPGPPYDQTANGATQLYTSSASDVALLQITNMSLVDAQNWNCFYAGWDNSDALTVTQGTGIHHPSADLKKICREDNALSKQTWSGAACWQIANWDQGVTEPGSSGSPLFDQNHRIIGQLYGGSAACSGTNDNNQPDYYGRFGVSWPNIDTWLAPASCGTAPTTNDGWDPVVPPADDDAGIATISSPVGNICSDTFDPVVTLHNYGANDLTSATINYDLDGGTNNTFSWTGLLAPGASLDVTLPTVTTTSGAHVFNVSTSSPNGTSDSNPINDAKLSNYNATIGGEQVTLTLDTDCWGYEVAWQILDGSMAVVQEGGNLSVIPGGNQSASSGDAGAYGDESHIVETFCLAVGCYDLIVYDDWGDGMNGNGNFGCTVDGNYVLTDASMNVLAAMTVADYGVSETTNFCLSSGCNGTVTSATSQEMCNADCDGSITVNASGATLPYSFDIGDGPQASNVFSGLCQGTYSITVEDGDNCTQIISVTLSGPSAINASATTTDELTGNDGSINLTAGGGTGALHYSWTGPGGFTASSEDLTGLASGTYSVTITDDNGCSFTLSNIVVDSQLGIYGTVFENMSVYPNPSTGQFTINLGRPMDEPVVVIIRDVTGRVVQQMQYTGAQLVNIDLQTAANGTYYLQLSSEGASRAVVLSVQH